MEGDRALLVRCLDLTALGDDVDEEAVEALCARAVAPVPADPSVHVAAVCIPRPFVARARARLAGSGVRVACATGGFPRGDGPLRDRLAEVRAAVAAGADEVDVVVDRGLLTDERALVGELEATRRAAGHSVWKAILETGALDPNDVRRLGRLALAAGADFLKTSTGMAGVPGATPEAARTLAGCAAEAGAGVKVSGGVRTAEAAEGYLDIVRTALGSVGPARFRIGASALLDALVG